MLVLSSMVILFYLVDFYHHRFERIPDLSCRFRQFVPSSEYYINVDTLSYNYLSFVLRDTVFFSSDPTYVLISNGNSYFFRTTYWKTYHDTVKAYGMRWLKEVPSPFKGKALLKEGTLPFIQQGKIKGVCIGDDLMLNLHASDLRYQLNVKDQWVFDGIHKDVACFPVQAEMFASEMEISKLAQDAPPAKYFIVFFDGHRHRDSVLLNKVLTQTLHDLADKNPHKIFWINLPPKTNFPDHYEKMFNAILDRLSHPNLKIIDFYQAAKSNAHLVYSNGYPTPEGWQYIVDQIRNEKGN